jgi:hypothetical protein
MARRSRLAAHHLPGPGGVGKTRLDLELTRATAEEDGTRVVFLSWNQIARRCRWLISARVPRFTRSAALIQDINRALSSARPHSSPES